MATITFLLIFLLSASIAINIFFLVKGKSNRFNNELNNFLSQNVSGRLSLSHVYSAGESGRGITGSIASHLNAFISKIRDILKNTFSIGFNLTKTSDSMKSAAKKMLDMSEMTSFQAAQVAAAMEEMSATINDIARNASIAAKSGATAMQTTDGAEGDIRENAKSITALAENISSWSETNKELSRATARIDEIVLVINDIADQTNLLALNAAIEAARAGEHGRGFAVVADEVRKLADKTGNATKEIARMIKDVKGNADNSLVTMDSTLKGVAESISRSKSAEASLRKIAGEVKKIADMVEHIATAAEEQSKVSEDVLSNMGKVSGYAADTKELATNISASGDSIASLALTLYGHLCRVKKDGSDEAMEELLKSFSASFASILEEAVSSGRLDRDALFDEAYVKVDESGKFSTRACKYFDENVLPFLKKCSQADKKIIYVVAMDRNGHMPTHTFPARAMVKMQDAISLGGAKSDKIIGQAFRRPVEAGGDLVVDIACPVVIAGRHWGCLRIGYLPEM